MRIVGYATHWDKEQGLQPIELQDIVLSASVIELQKLMVLLTETASKAERSGSGTRSATFGDSKRNSDTGIRIVVKRP